jgi:hypothetical protein
MIIKYIPKKDEAYAISNHTASEIYFEECPDLLLLRMCPHYAVKSLTCYPHAIISPPQNGKRQYPPPQIGLYSIAEKIGNVTNMNKCY